MIFTIIFLIALALIIIQVSFHLYRLRTNPDLLDRRSNWHILHRENIDTHIVRPFSQKSHDIFKKIVYTTLRWYRNIVQTLRKYVRKTINRVLQKIDDSPSK